MSDLDIIDGSNLHLLPGDAYPGLLDGWTGPILGQPGVIACFQGEPIGESEGEPGLWMGDDWTDLRLDLHRPECIDRVIRVLRAGMRCSTCDGEPVAVRRDGYGDINSAGPIAFPAQCPDCKGTGYLVAPADLSWTRDLPAWQAGAILAASVLRLATGEGPVRSLLSRYRPTQGVLARSVIAGRGGGFGAICRVLSADDYTRVNSKRINPTWGWLTAAPGGSPVHGPETDDSGRAHADNAALRAGYALDNGDHILVPLAGGKVARVESTTEVSDG